MWQSWYSNSRFWSRSPVFPPALLEQGGGKPMTLRVLFCAFALPHPVGRFTILAMLHSTLQKKLQWLTEEAPDKLQRWLRSMVPCVSKAALKVPQLPLFFEMRILDLTWCSFLIHQMNGQCPGLVPRPTWQRRLLIHQRAAFSGSQDCNCVWGKHVHKKL